MRKSSRKRKAVEEIPRLSATSFKLRKDVNVDTDIDESFFEEAKTEISKSPLETAIAMKFYVNIISDLHSQYQQVRTKYEELLPKIGNAERKLKTALELAANSGDCFELLKSRLADAWREEDACHMREQDAQQKMLQLEARDCANMKWESTKDDNDDSGQNQIFKTVVVRERDRLSAEVTDLNRRLEMQRNYAENLEYVNEKQGESMKKAQSSNLQLSSENQKLEMKIKNLQNIIEESTANNMTTVQKLELAYKDITEANAKVARQSSYYDQLKAKFEKLTSEKLSLVRQVNTLSDELECIKKERADLANLTRNMRLEDQAKSKIVAALQDQNKVCKDQYNQASKKLYNIDRSKNQLHQENIALKNEIDILKKELSLGAKKYEELNVKLDNSMKECESLTRSAKKLKKSLADLKQTDVLNNAKMNDLHVQIKKLNGQAEDKMCFIANLENERSDMAQQILSLTETCKKYEDKIDTQSERIDELTKKGDELYSAVNRMKKQLDSANSDNLILKRKLDSCGQDSQDMRSTVAKNMHQFTQMSNEIAAHNITAKSLRLQIERITSEKSAVQSLLLSTETKLSDVRKDWKEMNSKNVELLKIISDHESFIMKLNRELEETRKERNLGGLQLVRRNDEIIVMKDKMKSMQQALDRGTSQYNQRLEDIRLLKTEICQLQTDCECLKRALSSTANQREEVIRLQRKLNFAQITTRKLIDYSKIPVGVHRWRLLKGEDPNHFQLLQKIQAIQKVNIQLEVQKQNVCNKLKEEQSLNSSLKKKVEHLMKNCYIEKKYVLCQRAYREQEKKLKSVTAELRIREIEARQNEDKSQATLQDQCFTIKESVEKMNVLDDLEYEGFQEVNLYETSGEDIELG